MDVALPNTGQPYIVRAVHEWCTDQGFTPYLLVAVNEAVRVPREFVQEGRIVLNTSYAATGGLQVGLEAIEFKARFSGVARDIYVPIEQVLAIYARETGEGAYFELPTAAFDGDEAQEPASGPASTDAAAPATVTLVTASERGLRLVTPSDGSTDSENQEASAQTDGQNDDPPGHAPPSDAASGEDSGTEPEPPPSEPPKGGPPRLVRIK